ncbi:PspC domain-containing protein [Nocardioides sp. CER19]|uniref:PspC domain-containing protein n=1 Tax=Nocardioides sp. CER19 TaxID=3038538 RepID=UPI00244C2889|nr:PspC domain-containing protein [Nocardioides sp. CER19]MDH2413639.1 PspC domain-containing protein [Nocardioides sp. CER19]
MSTTDSPPPPTDQGPRISGQEARDLRGLRRTTKASPEGRYIAGVAGGLARHFDIDPVVVRVLLAVLVFFGGAGLLIYGAGWLFIPEEGSEQSTIPLDERNRSLALYVAAGLAALALLGDTIGSFHFPWPLAIIVLVLLAVLGSRDRVKASDWRPFSGSPTEQPTTTYGTTTYATTAPGHEAPAAPEASVVPPWAPAPPAYVPPPNPRRRGPILFWFTLGLIALSLGTLGIVDGAGASIPGSAYPAVAVGISGAMLVLGAFWGRAGGLILVGLLSTLTLVGSVGAQEYDGDGDHIHAVPVVAADLHDSYKMGAGELKVDLTRVSDLQNLDGRRLDLNGGVGTILVTIPDDVTVSFNGDVHGPGQIEFFGDGHGGIDTTMDRTRVAGPDAPTLTIDAELGVGKIAVRSE